MIAAQNSWSKWWWRILISGLIVLVGGWLRFHQLGEVPVGLYWDEIAMMVDAKSVATAGHDLHGRVWYQVLYPSYGDFKLPVYIWLASLSVKILGVSEFALRLPSAMAGLLTIITGGIIAWLLWRPSLKIQSTTWRDWIPSWSVMLVIAVSPWDVMFSRTAFEGHVGQLLLALSVVCLLLGRKKAGWLYLAAVVGGVATYSYFSVRFVWPAVFLAAAFFLYQPTWKTYIAHRKWQRLLSWKLFHILGPLVLFGLLLIPMFRSPLYGDSNRFRLGTDSVLRNEDQILQSNIYRERAGNTKLDRVVFHRYWLTARELLLNYADHVSLNFLFRTGDPNLRHGTGEHGLFLLIFAPFFVIGLYSLAHRQLSVLAFLVIWWLAALLPASVPENTPHALRSLNALMPLSLIIGWGLATVAVWLSQWRAKWLSRVVMLGLIVVIGISTAQFAYHYFKVYPAASQTDWQQGYREVAQAVFELRENKPVFVEGFDDKFYLWMMGYGPYTGQDFVQWPSIQYQLREFDRIYFRPFPGWASVPTHDSHVILVGRVAVIDELLNQPQFRILRDRTIIDVEGAPVFKVVAVEQQL